MPKGIPNTPKPNEEARADRERADRARRALQNIVAQLAEDDNEYSLLCALVTPLRNLLSRAGISPDVVDPPDQTLRLLDIGQQTLLGYEEARLRVDRGELNHRLRRLRDALAEFDAAPAVVSASDELTTLARYLTAAVEREEMLLAAQQQEAPAPAD